MSDFKFMFGLVAWHSYMTSLRKTVVKTAIYQAQATREASYLISDQIADLSADQSKNLQSLELGIELGLGLIGEKLDRQAELLEEISESLAEIREMLSAPERTKADEQFRIGKARLEHGLLKEALSAFLKVEAINEVDPIIQLVLGKIYLYGVDEGDPLIDLKLAKDHLLKAVRFSKLLRVDECRAEIFYHAAVLFYVLASESRLLQDGTTAENLASAQEFCAQAVQLWPYTTEYRYLLAKIYACSPDKHKLVHSELFRLFTVAPFYALLAQHDENFFELQQDIEEIASESKKTRLRTSAMHLADGMIVAEQEAMRLNAHELATARFQVLSRIRQELVHEIKDGLGYVRRNIAEGMHLSMAFYELATACRPCFDFTRNLQMYLLSEQQWIEERAEEERAEEASRLLRGEINDLRHRLAAATQRTESLVSRVIRKLNGPTEDDKHRQMLEVRLNETQELLKQLSVRQRSSRPNESSTPPMAYSLRIDDLSKEDFNLIRHEDKDKLFDAEANEHRQMSVRHLPSGYTQYRNQYELFVSMLMTQNYVTLGKYPQIRYMLAERYLSGRWTQVVAPEVPSTELSKINKKITQLIENKTYKYLWRGASGFEPIYYNLPRTLYTRITDGKAPAPEYPEAGPEHAAYIPYMVEHNLVTYEDNSTIYAEIRPEAELECLHPSAKAYLNKRIQIK